MTEPRLTTIVPSLVEGELRIHDIKLGERLGYAGPVDIRKLIRRWSPELTRMGTVATVATVNRGQKATEYYLNRRQAIFITAKSATIDATDITIEIIERFDAYERGVAPIAMGQVTQQLIEAAKAITETRAELAAMREDVRILRSGFDPTQKTVQNAFTMHEILEDQGALKPWRSLGVRCRSRMDRYSREHNMADAVIPGKSPYRYLYTRDLVRKWLADEGDRIIKANNDAVRGQGTLILEPGKPRRGKHLKPTPRKLDIPPTGTRPNGKYPDGPAA